MEREYMSSEGSEEYDWDQLQAMYDWPEWAVWADDKVFCHVKAPDFETARDKGVQAAPDYGIDVRVARIYATRVK